MYTKVFSFFAVLFAVSFWLNSEAAELNRDIPKARWEPIFFVPINHLTAKAGWKPLRETSLPSESLEVRIWIGFGLSPLEGYLFRRDGSHWTGRYVKDNAPSTNSVPVHEIAPNCGWEKLWSKFDALGLLRLPDSSTLPGEVMILDGVCYVVEINQDGRYRTYEYSNPKEQKWPEAKKIIGIAQVLHDEFNKK
jgi:hypothetical protein